MIVMTLAALAMQTLPDVQATPTPKPPAEKKICRTETATGSVMGHRVCHTQAEWAALAKASEGSRDGFRDKATNAGIPTP